MRGPSLPRTTRDDDSVDLANRSVDGALRTLARVTRTAIVIDADASAVASCARISVYAPPDAEPRALLTLVTTALAPQGLRLEPAGAGLILRRVRDAPLPASCTERPPVSSYGPPLNETVIEVMAGIRSVTDQEVLLTRGAVDRLLQDQSSLMSMRVVPHQVNGAAAGLKLYGIRRSSVPGALGLRNGDVLRSVGGHDVSSPDRALEAYAALRHADRVVVELERQGERVSILYRVVPRLPPARP